MSPLRTVIAVALLLQLLGPAPAHAQVVEPDPHPGPAGAAGPPGAPWSWPGDEPRLVLRPFLAPATRYGAGHRGIDIATIRVLAPADGTVHYSGILFGRAVLSIEHANGLLSSYEPVDSLLRHGDRVQRGQQLGIVSPVGDGSTGATPHCPIQCLHFGVRLYGEYVSPLTLVGTVPRSILLPRAAARRQRRRPGPGPGPGPGVGTPRAGYARGWAIR